MKLLFIGKRCPMGRDLISRPYGRFFYLPRYLAGRGHEVHSVLLDYRAGAPLDACRHGIHWYSETLRATSPLRYFRTLRRVLETVRPDWLVATSDAWYGAFAGYFGRRSGVPVCIDAYDNYESYMPWNKPLHYAWRRALAGADLVTAAGPGLLELMSVDREGKPGVIVPMAADPIGFEPRDRAECRRRMGLPAAVPLVGYCGSLHTSRGVDVLFRAFEQLRRQFPDAELVLSGRRGSGVRLPGQARWLGYVDDELMPYLLGSLDVLAVLNRDTAFGNYSYPVKLYEAMSCNIPVVATRTAATGWILREQTGALVEPGDSAQLCERLAASLHGGDRVHYSPAMTWQDSGEKLEAALLAGRTG